MSIAISIIGALIVLTILVVVHEGGHFLVGKWLGFRITEFAIGMGPKLLSKEKNGTVYSLRAFPIGGMCAFYGEDKDDEDLKKENAKSDAEQSSADNEENAEDLAEGAWNNMPAWKRFLVAFAGPFMNIVLAFVLAAILMMIFGEHKAVNLSYPVVTNFAETAPAREAGVEVGDIVTAVNGKTVKSTDEMIAEIRADEDGDIELTLSRPTEKSQVYINGILYEGDGEDFTQFCTEHPAIAYTAEITGCQVHRIIVTDTYNEEQGRNMIGASITQAIGGYDAKYNVLTAFPAGAGFVKDVMNQMFDFLGTIFTGGVKMEDVSGIVGVVDVVNDGVSTVIEQDEVSNGEKTSEIIQFMMYLGVLLSINLGIINLLPLPALDGGRIIFNIIEMAVGRAVPAKVEGIIHTVGLVLLLGLIAVITVKDVIFVFIK